MQRKQKLLKAESYGLLPPLTPVEGYGRPSTKQNLLRADIVLCIHSALVESCPNLG
jgi:hypothetical protein